ncbi:O-antigen ligase family protein [Paenibacillus sp. HB172176]|uniref:O-antigen ligase family protein n=1 Tax=Paenibacillus sp. HB172176 TaxID=2493690 RepID=UPI0014396F15|nr:O-antigen ligase family protein [Paenibacillus sp. HB172176]
MGASAKSKKRNYQSNLGKTEVGFLWWLGAAGIALFFLILPYQQGLFNGNQVGFEARIYKAAIYGLILLFIPAIYLVRGWRLNSHVGILSIAVIFMPLIYWISYFSAVSSYYASLKVIICMLLAALFITAIYSAQSNSTRTLMEGGLMVAGGIIVWFGIFNLFGQNYYKDAVWLASGQYRLSSVFQYPNTYAGLLIALFLASAYYAVHSSKNYVRLLNAAMLAPLWISFMLTYSRGAIVVIPVVVLLIVPLLRFSKQIAYFLYMGIAVIISMVVLPKLSSNADAISAIVLPNETKADATTISMFDKLPLQCWGLLLLAMAVTVAFVWVYHSKLDSWVASKTAAFAERKWTTVLIPAAIIVVGVLAAALLLASPAVRSLLPGELAARLETINFQQHSVLERLTFYKDGLKTSKDYPIIGAGGAAWQAIYEQYQNNPYESRQAHSFYVQTLVEIGWLGLLIMLALFAYIFYLYIRSHIRHPELRGSHLVFYIFALTLLAHSAIDFDMSYVYIGAIVFVSLGCMIAPFSEKLVISRMDQRMMKSWQQAIYPACLALLAIVTLAVTIQHNRAVSNFYKTISLAQKQTPFNQLIDGLDKSISISPNQPTYAVTKASWLMQAYDQNHEQQYLMLAEETINKAERYDKHSRDLFTQKLTLLNVGNQVEESLPVIEETLKKFPWDINFYNAALTNYAAARTAALATEQSDKAAEYAQRMHEISDEVNRRIELLEELPPEQLQGRDFSFTDSMKAAMATLD